jgi:hypothetical protein
LTAEVVAVSAKPKHGVDKTNRPVIRLLAGQGVEGDAHSGATVKHRSRWRRDPTQPNTCCTPSCSRNSPRRGSELRPA